MVSTLDFQAGYRGFESCLGRDNFQTIITPRSIEYKVDRVALGDRQQHQVCMGVP